MDTLEAISSEEEAYQEGVSFAEMVQAGLAAGKTFSEMNAFAPMFAARIRDKYVANGEAYFVAWYNGYLSAWNGVSNEQGN